MHFNFGASLLPGVVEYLILSPGNPLDSYPIIVSISPVGILKVLEIG